jgi:hypothetical protein
MLLAWMPRLFMLLFQAPAPPYVGPPRHHGGVGNKPIWRIVIHSTVSACEPGGARQIARYFMGTDRYASAHYTVDPEEVIQAAYDSLVCYAAPPNEHALHIEMCDVPGPVPGDKPGTARFKAALKAWRWNRANQKAMLRRTARLTAELCLAYGVPIRFVNWRRLRAGGVNGSAASAHGVTTHVQVSRAWRQTVHWDPGFWPQRRFMKMVRQEADAIRAEAPA